jgi:Sodium/calcium exchanger protein
MPRETRSSSFTPTGSGDGATGSRSSVKGVFRKEGEYWTVGCGGKSFRLKDTKGLGYLAHLLRHPAVEFHVLDLAGGIAGQRDDEDQSEQGLPRGAEDLEKAGIRIGSLGDAGEMLDEQAKTAYRRRLSQLREELEEAKEQGNVERAEHAEQEIDALTGELSRAVGLGGRNRRAISASERARQSIAKTIKAVLERIAQSDAQLGDIFARCIKTGNFCSYQPDPKFSIAWEFAATTIEPADQPNMVSDRASGHADCPQNPPVVRWLGLVFLAAYAVYSWEELSRDQESTEYESDLEPLKLRPRDPNPAVAWVAIQTLSALVVIFAASHLLVRQIEAVGPWLGLDPQLAALLLSPLATELPEIMNAVIWVRQGKERLALANISGAMMIQATVPTAFGLFFTPWRLETPSLIAAGVTVVAIIFLQWTFRSRHVSSWRLMQVGWLYVVFAGLLIITWVFPAT